jgi:DNA repair exonuclease SbcCD ATPase subunit
MVRMSVEDGRVGFALQRLEAGDDGLLEVEGEWSNVRGMRFVRPALVVREGGSERTLLATLEHKPWNPDGRPWRAAFPWDGGEIDPARAELAVAPSIVVPLASAEGEAVALDPADVLRGRLHEAQERIRHLEAEVGFLRREREERTAETDQERERAVAARDAARAAQAAAEHERDAARSELERRRERAARAEEKRVRAEREAEDARREREQAGEQARTVAREREQAERERARVARELEAARAAQVAAETARDEAIAKPSGMVPLAAKAERLRAESHEREATRADWAARVAAIVATLVLFVLLVTLLKVLL